MAKLTKDEIIDALKEMKMLEMNELISAIEETFNVKAIAQAVQADGDKTETKSDSVTISLKAIGGNKVAVIKVIRDLLGLGLMEAKTFVESAPKMIKEDIKTEEAKEIFEKLKVAGAEAEIK